MIVDRDVTVPMRDGASLAADVFRPDEPGEYPAILSVGPYGKDVHWPDRYPLYDRVDDGEYMVWETENPEQWVPHGYVVVRADSRGTGHSPGTLHLLARQDQEDAYDLIEWAAAQPWANGRVGMSGISWYAMITWLVAAMRPPHLTAIIPWDGLTDFYREWAYQGGIYHRNFTDFWWNHQIAPNQHGADRLAADDLASRRVDLVSEILEHPLLDEWHAERSAAVENIEIPVLSASAWGSLHLHLRGNVEAYNRVSSFHRRLLLFPGDHITPFYSDWALAERQRFFARWLREEPNGAESDAPVRLGLREGTDITWRDEPAWPLPHTDWTRWHLDAATRRVGPDAADPATATWHSPDGELDLVTAPATERVEITGPAALRLWVSTDAPDLDVFLSLWVLDDHDEVVPAYGIQGQQVPHAFGCLRASHRALDSARSTRHRPVHPHTEISEVPAGEPFPMEIEIWPTSIVLQPGRRLRLRLSSIDGWSEPPVRHDDLPDDPHRHDGIVTVHTGGRHDSALLLPVIPTP